MEHRKETLQDDQEDSKTSNPVQQVLSIVQIHELILQYAASGEKFSDAKYLRLVSKSWRELAFKALLISTDHPIIQLAQNQNREFVKPCHVINGLEAAKCIIPTSSHITSLSSPELPFQLQFSVRGSPEVIAFLIEYRKCITSILAEYNGIFIRIGEIRSEPEIHINEPLELPNLRFLTVRFGEKNFEPLHLLATHLAQGAKHLSKFEYIVVDAKLENVPANLTNLSILAHSFDTASWLENQSLPYLDELSLTCFGTRHFRPWVSQILRKFGNTLEYIQVNLVITDSVEPHDIDFQALELCNMPKVKTLKVRISPVRTSNGAKLSDIVPMVSCLQLAIQETTDLTMLQQSSFADLTELSISFASGGDIEPLNSIINFVTRQERTNGMLKSFNLLLELPYAAMLEACPLIFSQLGSSLTQLCVKFNQDEELDIERVFTGISKDEVPHDETTWPNILSGNMNTITNLKRLECLRVETFIRSPRQHSLGRFIFVAALFQMPQLSTLQITPKIQVDENLIQQWNERNGKVQIQNNFTF